MQSDRDSLLAVIAELEARRAENPLKYSMRLPTQDAVMRDLRDSVAFLGGNWIGKTTFAAQLVAGIGSHTYPVEGMFPNRPMVLWYVSHPKVFATVQPIIKQYLPKGWLVRTVSESAWVCDKFFGYADGGCTNFISWDIDPDSIEGPQVDVAVFDEPPPDIVRRKVLSRVRGDVAKKYYFFTPMAAASELKDALDGVATDRSRVGLHKAAIWENCKCLAGLSEEKLKRLGKPLSLSNETHPKDCSCNGGFNTQREISGYLAQFYGLELDAREWGEWMFLHRRILPIFDRAKHVVNKGWMHVHWGGLYPKVGTLYIVLDPHGSRPDFIQFWVCCPDESLYLVAELPCFVDGEFRGKLFKDIHNYYRPTLEIAKLIVAQIKAIGLPIGEMVIDPRGGGAPVKSLYSAGHKVIDSFNEALEELKFTSSRFRAIISDKDNVESIEDGHRRINDQLAKMNRITERAFIGISELCENTIWAAENYRREEDSDDETKAIKEKPEERVKDPMDCWRYLNMINPTFRQSDAMIRANANADYGRMREKLERDSDYNQETVYAL